MISDFLQNYILVYGLTAAFVMMVSNGFVSAPPSEAVLSISGALLVNNFLDLIYIITLLSFANLVGNYLLYLIGLRFGSRLFLKLRFFCRKSKIQFLRKTSRHLPSKKLLLRLEKRFDSSGYKWVLILRCLPVVRSIVAIPAGAAKMKQFYFIVFSFVGMFIWSTGWVTFGYTMKSTWVYYQLYISIPLLIMLSVIGVIIFQKYKMITKQLVLNEINK